MSFAKGVTAHRLRATAVKTVGLEATHLWYYVSLVLSTLIHNPSRSIAANFSVCWGNYLPTCLFLQSTQNITQSSSGLSLISGHIVMTSLSASKPRQACTLRHHFKCLPWWGACWGLQLLCGRLQIRRSTAECDSHVQPSPGFV